MIRNGLVRTARWAVRILLGLGAMLLCYFLAGLAGSALPVNRDWTPPAQGVTVYVIDNGIHTDLVLPVSAEGVAWDDLVRSEHFADGSASSHLAFGWGDRDFYLNTPTWWDLNPLRIARAMAGAGDTVVHVAHVAEPRIGADAKAVVLRPEEYHRLAAFIRATFGEGPRVRGYGARDAFYVARGGYSLFRTCNAWTGEALGAAGVRVGKWTPFPSGVMQWF